MAFTIYNIDVVGYDSTGKRIDGRTHQTHVLNSDNRYWCVAQRMAKTVNENKKVKIVRYFLEGVEYVLNDEYEMVETGKKLKDFQ